MAGALGFGAGIASGFADALVRHQERQDQLAREDRARKLEAFKVTHPVLWEQAQANNDYRNVEANIFATFPDVEKEMRKKGFSFDQLGALLGNQPAGGLKPREGAAPTAQAPVQSTFSPTIDNFQPSGNVSIPEPPPIPSRSNVTDMVPTTPRPGGAYLFGQPMPTVEERAAREAQAKDRALMGNVDLARRLTKVAPDLFGTPDRALAAVGFDLPTPQRAPTLDPGGFGAQVTRLEALKGGPLTPEEVAKAKQEWEKLNDTTPKLPAQMNERVAELRALHPTWTNEQLEAEAGKLIGDEREADRKAKADAADAFKTSRQLLDEQRRTNLALLRRENGGSLTPAQVRTANSLADDYARDSKPYLERLDAFQTLQAAASGAQTPGSDLALVFAFMKMIDPGSTVREGERAVVENSRAVSDTIRNLYNRVVEGTRLTPAQRQDLRTQAIAQFAPAKVRQRTIEATYRQRALQAGIPANAVIIQYDSPADAVGTGGAGAPNAPVTGPGITGGASAAPATGGRPRFELLPP